MDTMEFTRRIIAKYYEDVKPYIDSGDYELASIAMTSLNFGLRSRSRDIVSMVHCGLALVSQATLLEDRLEKKDPRRIKFTQQWFETYIAQTRLPIA